MSKDNHNDKGTAKPARQRVANTRLNLQAFLLPEQISTLFNVDPDTLKSHLKERVRLDTEWGAAWQELRQLAVLLALLNDPQALKEAIKDLAAKSTMKLEPRRGGGNIEFNLFGTPVEMVEFLNIVRTPSPAKTQVVSGEFAVMYNPETHNFVFSINGIEGRVSTLVPVAKGMKEFFEALAKVHNVPEEEQAKMFKPYGKNGHDTSPEPAAEEIPVPVEAEAVPA
ncbi:hypothetical protein C4561_03775 [candidate division WWE3 bacterium]|jgi:hypothetical protein|uniref:Uncharacterized protein n=1 Tax=candidate division WWE3 bacterium TaxID=2053526 RepID=A0A3A4ZJ46_UNCKA|nr:MAG: hypothetical protein C4561_03775 [candidate division WWE3 bacterium]